MNANEVQGITTWTPDVNEIQVITTSATPLGEVQAITVSPPPGQISVNGAYSFALSLDTTAKGGSLEYSGQISATADENGSRTSVSEILGSMLNIDSTPVVTKSGLNPDGGHTYTVTFPTSMGNIPQMQLFLSDLPVSVATIEDGNVLSGSFQLEYSGELTTQIPFDASESIFRMELEKLPSIGTVAVTRGPKDDQYGYSWQVEFTSDMNSGNLENIVTHGEGLMTSNDIGGSMVKITHGGRDGSYIDGSFQVEFGK